MLSTSHEIDLLNPELDEMGNDIMPEWGFSNRQRHLFNAANLASWLKRRRKSLH